MAKFVLNLNTLYETYYTRHILLLLFIELQYSKNIFIFNHLFDKFEINFLTQYLTLPCINYSNILIIEKLKFL